MNPISVDPLDDSLWTELVTRRPSSAFHSPAWLRVLAATYGFRPRAQLLLDRHGVPVAGLPYCLIEDMKGRRIVTLPFSDYCDPLVTDVAQWYCLVEALLQERCPLYIRCLHHPEPLQDRRFDCYAQARWHGLDLRSDLDTLWAGLENGSRRAIRKAQRNGVAVRAAASPADLRAFFEMHLEVRKYKYHLLAQPYRFFEQIWEQFVARQQGLILLAVYQQQIIAAIWFLKWQNGLYYKFNASHATTQHLRPNDLLTWEGICYGKRCGYTHLDFGLSDWDQEGLLRYKRKFASEEKPISFLRHIPDSQPRQDAQELRALLPHLTDLFTDSSVPDSITEKAGDLLYHFFV